MSLQYRPSAVVIAVVFALSVSRPAPAETQVLDAMTVRANRETPLPANADTLNAHEITGRRAYVSDTARLLDDVPGVSFYGSGGVSSLPVIRGMNDDRIRIRVDGMDLTSACGNHMNPPLSYVDPAAVGGADVIAGITPVSLGGDSIAGTIVINPPAPVYAGDGEASVTHASLSGSYRSNGNALGVSGRVSVATAQASLSYVGAVAHSDNYTAGNGDEMGSTQYRTENHAVSLAIRHREHQLITSVGTQRIPYQAYPNAWMDMVENDAVFGNLRYEGRFVWGKAEARAYYEQTWHKMNFLEDKLPGDMPMRTNGRNLGYSLRGDLLVTERDTLRIGNEFLRFRLDDVWPPVAGSMMMGPGTFENIDDGRRDRLGFFAEWEARWSQRWSSLLGARYDRVDMDTDDVRPYALTGMMQSVDIAAANAFNARGHARVDDNFDITVLGRYTADPHWTLEAGYARKSRSPNLYERYAWGRGAMAMNMNGWFGDGNGYVGDIDLNPEVAHTFSGTINWHNAAEKRWSLGITPYYTFVSDYIDVDRCLAGMGMMGGGLRGCPPTGGMPQTADNTFVYLQFANHDVRIYGVDVSGTALLASGRFGEIDGRGVLGYVRGENRDTGDNLYHMMPVNAKLAFDHRWKQWSSTLEVQLVAAKEAVQSVRNETETDGYGLLNLRTSHDGKYGRLDIGVENLLDRNYDLPLGGAYIGEDGNQVWGNRVAGMGRSIYAGLTIGF